MLELEYMQDLMDACRHGVYEGLGVPPIVDAWHSYSLVGIGDAFSFLGRHCLVVEDSVDQANHQLVEFSLDLIQVLEHIGD